MIFHFQTGDVTFFPEDQEYFEKRFAKLEQLLGFDAGDSDSLEIRVVLSKSKHHSGDRFEGSATVHCPGGKFYAETIAEDMKKCADELKKKLRAQVEAFHGKRK
ncbi:HPF/RaiA family ribosome-associated protein [Candidatus Gracilibacteria bacterium]|nr:HPF/RaiA family ribosome-associated protein [Candidatus Gracilibacteria bacterium]